MSDHKLARSVKSSRDNPIELSEVTPLNENRAHNYQTEEISNQTSGMDEGTKKTLIKIAIDIVILGCGEFY